MFSEKLGFFVSRKWLDFGLADQTATAVEQTVWFEVLHS